MNVETEEEARQIIESLISQSLSLADRICLEANLGLRGNFTIANPLGELLEKPNER